MLAFFFPSSVHIVSEQNNSTTNLSFLKCHRLVLMIVINQLRDFLLESHLPLNTFKYRTYIADERLATESVYLSNESVIFLFIYLFDVVRSFVCSLTAYNQFLSQLTNTHRKSSHHIIDYSIIVIMLPGNMMERQYVKDVGDRIGRVYIYLPLSFFCCLLIFAHTIMRRIYEPIFLVKMKPVVI
jgi:hypothetical protein